MSLEPKIASKRVQTWHTLYLTVLGVVFLVFYIGLTHPLLVTHGALTYVAAPVAEANKRQFVHGIFTIPEMKKERDVHRDTWMTSPLVCTIADETEECAMVVYFVMGTIPNGSRQLVGRENTSRADIIELDIVENMNSGKSFEWFRFAALHFRSARFISKGDMDTIIFPREVLRSVSRISRDAQGIYGGFVVDWNMCGGGSHCPFGWIYMAGPFYFLSQDLVQWLGSVNNTIVRDNSAGHEDLQIGKCLYLSRILISYMNWGYSTPAWSHPVKNMSKFYVLHQKDDTK